MSLGFWLPKILEITLGISLNPIRDSGAHIAFTTLDGTQDGLADTPASGSFRLGPALDLTVSLNLFVWCHSVFKIIAGAINVKNFFPQEQ